MAYMKLLTSPNYVLSLTFLMYSSGLNHVLHVWHHSLIANSERYRKRSTQSILTKRSMLFVRYGRTFLYHRHQCFCNLKSLIPWSPTHAKHKLGASSSRSNSMYTVKPRATNIDRYQRCRARIAILIKNVLQLSGWR